MVDLPETSFPGPENYPKLTRWFDKLIHSDVVTSVTQSLEHGSAFMNAYATHQELSYDLGLDD